ncbi:ComF family protein [Streptomyces sp. TRM49041]|uniref:ComF family protein n=1 Tax=Streptomyces sp. TRM49041 TaxID=2603216 RepID=UPI0011ED11EE|nr:ComF family protein [Streptomyces sp. TRM49041]
MRGWWQEITGLVLPVTCAGCGRSRTALCDTCARSLHGRPPVRVRPEPEPAGLPGVWAAAPYADAVRAVLLAHKERGALGLAPALGVAVAGAVRAAAGGEGACWGTGVGGGGAGALPLVLVPVPSARRAVRARGHDAVRRVAVAAAGELRRAGLAARAVPVLRQRRAVADQAGLDAKQRLANLAGALEVVAGGGRLLRGARVVLVDDLMTTGASLAEAARALRDAAVRDAAVRESAAGDRSVPDAAMSDTSMGGTALGDSPAGNPVPHGAAGSGRAPRDVVPSNPAADDVAAYHRVLPFAAIPDAALRDATFRGAGVPGSAPRDMPMGAREQGLLISAAVVAASPKAFAINRN